MIELHVAEATSYLLYIVWVVSWLFFQSPGSVAWNRHLLPTLRLEKQRTYIKQKIRK